MALKSLNSEVGDPSRIVKLDTIWNTTVKRWPNGRRSARRNYTQPIHVLHVEYDGMTGAEYEALVDFFNEHYGAFAPFKITDTHTEDEYTVCFEDDKLSRQMVKKNTRGLYIVKFTVEEDR